MTIDEKHCPNCQTKLEVVPLSDLMTEKEGPDMGAAFKLMSDIFSRFIFYVCYRCGRTLVYAVPEIRKLAAESSDEIIGNS